MVKTPRVNSEGQKELDKIDGHFQDFHEKIQAHDPFGNKAAIEEAPQSQLTKKQLDADAPYLKPVRSMPRSQGGKDGVKVYFDEKHREQHDRDWEYVKCIVENYEIIGEQVEAWTAKWGCDPAHFWKVPVNKPVWIPRLLAEQLSKCKYHRLRMDNTVYDSHAVGAMYGTMIADDVKHRIDCKPVGFGF